MVTVNINLDEDVAARLRAIAEKTGQTIDEVASDLLASLSAANYELTEEEERALDEAEAEIDRGEFVTSDELFAKLKAQRR
jgi:predicted transcriptional regulator